MKESQIVANPFPDQKSQLYRLLAALLRGEKVTALSAIMDMNILIVSARISELRRMGWPIRSMTTPHPNRQAFPGETLPVYFLDQHFRRWIGSDGKGKHPALYPDTDGRGKFANWTVEAPQAGTIP